MKLSIIIPIYNTPEELLIHCLEQLVNLSELDYEVLLVDDGSSVDISSMVAPYLNHQVHYYRKENGGVSSARNLGIAHALGEWLTFVDPDDWVSLTVNDDFFARHQMSDIIFWPYSKVAGDNQERKRFTIEQLIDPHNLGAKQLMTALLRVSEKVMNRQGFYLGTPWGKFFKKSFLEENGLEFDVDLRKRQDALFCAKAYLLTEHFSFVEEELRYFYRVDNESSITKNYNPKIKQAYQYLFTSMSQLYQNYGLEMNNGDLAMYGCDLIKELINLDFCHLSNPGNYQQRKTDFLTFRNFEPVANQMKALDYKKLPTVLRVLYYCENKKWFAILNGVYLFRKLKNLTRLKNFNLNKTELVGSKRKSSGG